MTPIQGTGCQGWRVPWVKGRTWAPFLAQSLPGNDSILFLVLFVFHISRNTNKWPIHLFQGNHIFFISDPKKFKILSTWACLCCTKARDMHSPDSGENEVISLTIGQGWHSALAAVNTKFFRNASLPAMYHRFLDSFISTLGQKPFDLGAFNGLCFPYGSAGKESTCNEGDLGLIPGLGRSPGEGIGYPLQYSGLGNSMDYIVHGVAKSRIRLRDFHFH